jgi:hypothetical protein
MQWATVSAASGSALSTTTTNSSPPSRATVSDPPEAAHEPPGDRGQEQVADLVAEGVVDLLEVVEVDEGDADPVRAGPVQRGGEPAVEQDPVRQPGQRVVGRAVVELREQPSVVPEDGDLPEDDHRGQADRDGHDQPPFDVVAATDPGGGDQQPVDGGDGRVGEHAERAAPDATGAPCGAGGGCPLPLAGPGGQEEDQRHPGLGGEQVRPPGVEHRPHHGEHRTDEHGDREQPQRRRLDVRVARQHQLRHGQDRHQRQHDDDERGDLRGPVRRDERGTRREVPDEHGRGHHDDGGVESDAQPVAGTADAQGQPVQAVHDDDHGATVQGQRHRPVAGATGGRVGHHVDGLREASGPDEGAGHRHLPPEPAGRTGQPCRGGGAPGDRHHRDGGQRRRQPQQPSGPQRHQQVHREPQQAGDKRGTAEPQGDRRGPVPGRHGPTSSVGRGVSAGRSSAAPVHSRTGSRSGLAM